MGGIKPDYKNIFVGSKNSAQLVKSRLEIIGIEPVIKKHVHSGDMSTDDVNSFELYVTSEEFIQANQIIGQLVEEGKIE